MGLTIDLTDKKAPPSKYDKHLTASQGQAAITVVKSKDGGEKKAKTTYQPAGPTPVVAKEELCQVTFSGGRTVSPAPYESIRVDVSLTIPCAKGDIADAYKFASEWVSDRINEALQST